MLKIKNLSISFGENTVVKNSNFEVKENSILGIVGESGSGKSVSSLTILGLLPKSTKIEGEVLFYNNNLLKSTPIEKSL